MIPRKIHYVWVGTRPKSELVLKCIDSWKSYLPGYEIIEWNNASLRMIKNTYAEQAYANGKWAFVSDYIRLYALFHEGGIYLDSDVEVVADLDPFLTHDFFTGYENYRGVYAPVTAVMGATRGNRIIGDLLTYYSTARFEVQGGLDLLPNTATIADYFARTFGLRAPYVPNAVYKLDEMSVIFPSTHFCTPEPGCESYAVHHFSGSWINAFARRTKATLFGRLTVVRFRRQSSHADAELPLLRGEKLLFTLNRRGRVVWALVYRQREMPVLPDGRAD